ncbi:MAG TPA: type II toxin-antitoxin system PemK/MazF family toxin [Actinoplanes sp.]|jgi:mRNA interferase MazF
MVIRRGAIYWADVDGARRPVLVVQAQAYNDSRLPTVLAAVLTSNTKVASMPGNVFLPAAVSGLPDDAVVNVAVLLTVDKARLDGPIGDVPAAEMSAVEGGLQGVLGLST